MQEYRFKIDAFTPETLPMARLSSYLAELARLLGEPEHVHLAKVDSGSAVLVAKIDQQAYPKVSARVHSISIGAGDVDALKAWKRLDDLLAEDGALGFLADSKGTNILEFPGRLRPKPLRYGPFKEDGVLEGKVIRVGGKDETVPVWLRDQEAIHKCTASVEIARQLAAHVLADTVVRVRGSGKWLREQDGSWILDRFVIHDFDILDDAPLTEVIKELQAVKGAEWGEDPIGELLRLRRGDKLN